MKTKLASLLVVGTGDIQVVPRMVSGMAVCLEKGQQFTACINAGKSWAVEIALAKPAIKQLKP